MTQVNTSILSGYRVVSIRDCFKTRIYNFWRSIGLMAAMVLAFHSPAALAAWVQATGTSGIRFGSISKVGNTLYAGSLIPTGLYQSTDDGANWAPAFGNYFDSWYPRKVTQIGSMLYVVGGISNVGRLAYSSNSGLTWTEVGSWGSATGLTDISMFNGATFVAAYSGGVYKSITNDGAGWVLSSTGLGSPNAYKFAQSGTDIFVQSATSTAGTGVYRTTDSGSNWTTAATGLSSFGGAASGIVNYNGTLFVASNAGGVWKSTDGGASWTQSLPNTTYDLVINNGTLYAIVSGAPKLYTTTDGINWTNQDMTGITAPYLQPGAVIID